MKIAIIKKAIQSMKFQKRNEQKKPDLKIIYCKTPFIQNLVQNNNNTNKQNPLGQERSVVSWIQEKE